MEPAYHHGDRLLVNRLAYLRRLPRPGDVVVLRDPEHPERLLLKRVMALKGEPSRATVYVVGDNSRQSRDSRTFGAVPLGLVVGRACRKY